MIDTGYDKPKNNKTLKLVKSKIFRSIITEDFKNRIDSNKSINNCNIK